MRGIIRGEEGMVKKVETTTITQSIVVPMQQCIYVEKY